MDKKAMAKLMKDVFDIGFLSNIEAFSKSVGISEERFNDLVSGKGYPSDSEMRRINIALSDVEYALEAADNDKNNRIKNFPRRLLLENLRDELFDE